MAGLTEAQWQKRITDYCDWLGLKWHHETDSRRSRAGFPDLVIVGTEVMFVELKTDKGRVTPEQYEWLDALSEAGVQVHLWRPDDWTKVQNALRRIARK